MSYQTAVTVYIRKSKNELYGYRVHSNEDGRMLRAEQATFKSEEEAKNHATQYATEKNLTITDFKDYSER